MFNITSMREEQDWPYLTSNHGMLTHTWDYLVNVTGAAQTLALYWSVLSSHCCQNGRRREQCLTYPRSHPHQPKQVHCVRPLPHGEDHLREAECGAWSSHSLNLPTPLLLSLRISVCWKVNIFFSFACLCWRHWRMNPTGSFHGVGQIDSPVWGLYWWIT